MSKLIQAAGIVLLLSTFAVGWAQDSEFDSPPVTDEMLADPAPEDWLLFRRALNGWAYSPLEQVNQDNVSGLTLAWSRAMEPGPQETTPIVYDGVMYLAHPGDVIQALDATNGDLIWEYRRELPEDVEEFLGSLANVTRNIAIYGDTILHAAADGYVIALDAGTGQLAWETQVVDYRETPARHSSGPIVANGRVITGRSCDAEAGPAGCFIAAHDVQTGEELWRTHLIPRPGEPGDETWGDVPYESRRHVGAWVVGSYDPDLNLIYWGTSVPAPSLEVVRGTPGLDVLYSNSTLALDAETGEMVWYYQHLPRDNWDLDHPFERYLVDTVVSPNPDEVDWINPNVTPGEERQVVTGIPGKTGIVYTLDRETGEFLWATQTIYQNVILDIDGETGVPTLNEDLIVDPFVEVLVCPSSGGGKDWPAGTYSPRTNTMYQPQQNMCMNLTGNTDEPTPAEGYATTRITAEDPTVEADPYEVGRVDAVRIDTGEQLWLHQQRAGFISGLVSTGGGLVFGGDVNRRFYAFNDETGEVLWSTIVSGPVSGHPISYEVDGRQYVAVPVGGGSASPENRALSLTPEIRVPQGLNSIVVFALPE